MPANQGEQAPSRGVKEQDTTVFTRGLKKHAWAGTASTQEIHR